MIKVLDLELEYPGGVQALDGVTFSVERGEIFGFLGPNGAGKTTAIKIFTCLLRPTAGSVQVAGFDVVQQQNEIRNSIGYVSQTLAVDDRLTGRENLELQGRLYHIPKNVRRQRIQELLETTDLQDRADDLVGIYSGGMRKRLDIACGLIHRPKILFLDEPTLGLDVQTRHRIWAYIRNLQKTEDVTIFLTTHYMDEADELCLRIALIDHGKIKALDEPGVLKDQLGGDVIWVELEGETRFDDATTTALTNVVGVRDVKLTNSTFRIVVEQAERILPGLLNVFQKQNLVIRTISMKKPNLDEVYLMYTGRALREETSSRDHMMAQQIHMQRSHGHNGGRRM